MANCFRNIHTKNYYNLKILLEVTIENVRDAFFETQCILILPSMEDKRLS